MFSNKYIFIYATVLVIVVAALLSTAAKVLQPFQERNAGIEKIQSILTAAGISSTKENAESLFNKHIINQILIAPNGEIINDGRKAFDIDLKTELKKSDDLKSGKSTVEPAFPMFVMDNDGGKTYIIPMLGKGLWGALWGYVALNEDFNTIVGVVFDHKGETPGLGAEIATETFQNQFVGKKIFDEDNRFVSIAVLKGGVANQSAIDPKSAVDAISGGTITSEGLDNMIKLSFENYLPYFQKQREGMPESETAELTENQEKIEHDELVEALEEALCVDEKPKPAHKPKPIVTEGTQPIDTEPVTPINGKKDDSAQTPKPAVNQPDTQNRQNPQTQQVQTTQVTENQSETQK